MSHLNKSAATLRIFGDDLVPQEISELLGGEPTFACAKGGLVSLASGRTRVAQSGQWHLRAADTTPENLDAQVKELFDGLTADLSVWRALSSRFDVNLFCGWFMQEGNEGVTIAPDTLLALGERGIELGLDIYGPASH